MSKIIDLQKKKGTIYVGNIHNYDLIDADLYYYCDYIVSDDSSQCPEGCFPLNGIAPSWELMLQIKAWIDNCLLDNNIAKIRDLYIDEIKERNDAKECLDIINGKIYKGNTIVIFDNCYHKSYFSPLHILKDYLLTLGYQVKLIS